MSIQDWLDSLPVRGDETLICVPPNALAQLLAERSDLLRDNKHAEATLIPLIKHSAMLSRIANIVSRYAPDGVCETDETVRYLCQVVEGAIYARKELERINTAKLAVRELCVEATAISSARVYLNAIDAALRGEEVP